MQQRQSPPKHPIPSGQAAQKSIRPISLRVKILVGFSIIFSLVFAGSFYWFYKFTTDKLILRLRLDIESTLEGASKGVDVEELMALYREGRRNAEGFSDDPRYLRQLAWFETVHQIEPRAWLYSYVIGNSNTNRRMGPMDPDVKPGKPELIFLVDLWSKYNPAKAAKFLQSDNPGPEPRNVLIEGKLIESSKIYQDPWGKWLSAFTPLRDKEGKIVAILGLDIQADYIDQVQQQIRNRVFIAFIATYSVLFILIYALSGVLTQQLSALTHSAERIGTGNYDLDLSALVKSRFPDEMNILAQVFESMMHSIRTREQMILKGKQAEYEMYVALQEERELNELKSRFVSMVSHELRTPLTIIRTSLELLERFGNDVPEEKRLEYFQRSRFAVQNMAQLLEDVLMLGKAEAKKLEFNPIELNLKQFCLDIVEEMQLGLGSRHTITFVHTGDYPRAYLDPNLLRSILTNLLSNAIKYSPPNSTIEFELIFYKTAVDLVIRDHGIGIPKADQPRLFEVFHRASNTSAIRGTGLGLAIVRECVTCHRGQVTFTSEEGVGTTFTVKLPLHLQPLTSDNP